MAKTKEKDFDCVKWTREVRDRIYEETKHMTLAEYRQWLESRRPTQGALAKLWDRRIDLTETVHRRISAQ